MIRKVKRSAGLGAVVAFVLYVVSFYCVMDEYPAFGDDYRIAFRYSFKYANNSVVKDRNGWTTVVPKVHLLNYFYYPVEMLHIYMGASYDKQNLHLPFDVDW